MTRFFLLLPLAVCMLQPRAIHACGYGFVGDCSTNIGLRINGTADSFAVAPCPGITDFHGLQLGTIQSLALIRAKSINWESCQNNVAVVTLYFRVFQTGTAGGTWQTVVLQENYNTLVGPYTTRYRSINANVNLTNGLIIGKNYTMEAYFRADVDTIGDDFVPETFILQNNDGLNYHLSFRYGGPSAPPFTVVETKKSQPICFGDTTGSVSVGVYGNQTGLFYHWGNANNNFNALYNLTAGTYTVTVTGVNGYSQADTILLGQPAAIANQFTNLVPLGCNNGIGQVTAQPSGGTGPYAYHWSNNQSTATVTVAAPGNYLVTVTDSHGCTQGFAQFIPGGSSPISQYISAEICSGEAYHRGNQTFSQSGAYDFTLPGLTGCDTIVHLQLTVLNAGVLLANLPASGLVTCTQPELNLCATAGPNAAFAWKKDGVDAVITPCILATAGGVYSVTATLTGASKSCSSVKNIAIQEHLLPPTASMVGQIMLSCLASPPPTWVYAVTNAQAPTYQWTFNGQIISIVDSCQVPVVGPGGVVLPTLVVTDVYGCSVQASNNVVFVQNGVPFINLQQQNLCNGSTKVSYDVFGGTPPYQITWNNAGITTNPFNVPPGLYLGTVTDAAGCMLAFTLAIQPFSIATTVQMATGPLAANGSASAEASGGTYPYSFLWSTGSSSQQIGNLPPGDYCVTVTDDDGCTQETCVVVSYPNATQAPVFEKISVSPNPVASGEALTLRLPERFVGEHVEIELLDALGRRILLEDRWVDTAILQMKLPAHMPTGLVLLRIRSAVGQLVGRCVAR